MGGARVPASRGWAWTSEHPAASTADAKAASAARDMRSPPDGGGAGSAPASTAAAQNGQARASLQK